MTSDHEDVEGFRLETMATEAAVAGQTKHALTLWAVRWAFGFAIIWTVTTWTGSYGWLWTAGFVVAGLSLVTTLAFRLLFQKRLQATHFKLDALNKTLEEYDAEEGRD